VYFDASAESTSDTSATGWESQAGWYWQLEGLSKDAAIFDEDGESIIRHDVPMPCGPFKTEDEAIKDGISKGYHLFARGLREGQQ
jgi:hypothetical protein